jgi:hypothetical protein
MPKPVDRVKPSHSKRSRSTAATTQSGAAARADTREPVRLLDRMLNTPHLAQVIPQLQPEVFHRVIQTLGLEDSGELVALATPDQLANVFDLDLWRADEPGVDEHFDADRFGVWLQVLMESGASAAAQTLVGIDADLVITALAEHALVFDRAAVMPPPRDDGDEEMEVRSPHDGISFDVGGYLIVARSAITHTESWDAITAVLIALNAQHQAYFHRVMRGCRSLSNSAPEIDGLDDLLGAREQVRFDVALDRERRREQRGYVTPAQARAFLQMSRELRRGGDETAPSGNPVARAYFRGIEWTTAADAESGTRRLLAASGAAQLPDEFPGAVAAFVDVLVEAGVLPQPPRALLDGAKEPAARLARIRKQMQVARDRDEAAYSIRSQELAYLANALVAGCSIQARPVTLQEGTDAAVAACNLGLENWPPHWLPAAARRGPAVVQGATVLPDDFLVGQDLVAVFQVGWSILYERVCLYTAQHLVQVLTHTRYGDRETRGALNALRVEMKKHVKAGAPWRSRDALDVIAILDAPAWMTLLGLTDECPVIHAGIAASQGTGVRAISASAFDFISENSQIAAVHEFMRILPETLRS